MSEMQIQNVLRQMRTLAQSAGIEQPSPPQSRIQGPGEEGNGFADVLLDSLRTVNSVQKNAAQLQTRFELGDDQVTLPKVMVAMSKSSLAFEATNQVRNRLLTAYQEIMRMQV